MMHLTGFHLTVQGSEDAFGTLQPVWDDTTNAVIYDHNGYDSLVHGATPAPGPAG